MAGLLDGNWMAAGASLLGGLLGSQSNSSSQSNTQTRAMDPRMDRYVYGSDGQSGLLGGAWGLMQKQAANGGLNDLQRQGMEMQRQYLMSPQYQNSYGNMMSAGQSLMGGGVAGNPFTSGGGMGGVSFGGGSSAAASSQSPAGSAPPVNGSIADKAAWYRSQQAAGLSDDQIRAAVNSQVGQQSDTDWNYLRGAAAQQAQVPVIRGNQQQPAFQYDPHTMPASADIYFQQNPDVAAAFAANNYGLTKEQFAKTHFDKYGQFEQRAAPLAGIPDYSATAPGLLSPANQQVVNRLNAGAANGGGGSGGNATGNGGGFSIGVGQMTDAINSSALSAAQKAALLGLPAAAIAGLYSQYTASHGFMDAINQAADPIGALAAAQGWTDTDPGYNAWGGGYSDSGGGWGNGGYGFGGGTGGMGD